MVQAFAWYVTLVWTWFLLCIWLSCFRWESRGLGLRPCALYNEKGPKNNGKYEIQNRKRWIWSNRSVLSLAPQSLTLWHIIDQAVVEVGTISVRNVSHSDLRVALVLLFKICDGIIHGKYGGSKLGSKTIDLCGGAHNKIPISDSEVTTQFLGMNFVQVYDSELTHPNFSNVTEIHPFPDMEFLYIFKFCAVLGPNWPKIILY